VVPHGQLTAHPHDEPVEVVAAGYVPQKWGIFRLHRRPVRPVHPRIIEKVAVDTPRLIENLGPLSHRIDLHLQGVHIQHPLSGFGLLTRIGNPPALPLPVKHLLAVGRQLIPVSLHHLALLPLLHVEFEEPGGTRSGTRVNHIEDFPRLAHAQVIITPGTQGKVDNTAADPLQVNGDLLHSLLFCSFRGFFVCSLSLFFPSGIFTGFGRVTGGVTALCGLSVARRALSRFRRGHRFALFIALTRKRMGKVGTQRGQVYGAGHPHVVARLVKPVDDRPCIGRRQEKEVLPVGVENRTHGIAHPVGDRGRLPFFHRVEVYPPEMGGGHKRVGDPP